MRYSFTKLEIKKISNFDVWLNVVKKRNGNKTKYKTSIFVKVIVRILYEKRYRERCIGGK